MTHEYCQADSNLCCNIMNEDIISAKPSDSPEQMAS